MYVHVHAGLLIKYLFGLHNYYKSSTIASHLARYLEGLWSHVIMHCIHYTTSPHHKATSKINSHNCDHIKLRPDHMHGVFRCSAHYCYATVKHAFIEVSVFWQWNLIWQICAITRLLWCNTCISTTNVHIFSIPLIKFYTQDHNYWGTHTCIRSIIWSQLAFASTALLPYCAPTPTSWTVMNTNGRVHVNSRCP